MAAWFTPFIKQCLVTLGVSANVGQFGLVMSYTAVLLPQLQAPNSPIPLGDDTASWIAAVPGFALLLGNLTVPIIMGRFGRRSASISSVVIVAAGWLCVVASQSVACLIAARLLQGLSMGMSTSLGPCLIGEYTSPRHRGALLSTVALSMSTMTLLVHTLGVYLSWSTTALICAIITLLDLLIVLFSPESPAWLAAQGRYDECKKVFHWLRGDTQEEHELRKLIESSQLLRESQIEANVTDVTFRNRLRKHIVYFTSVVKKKEFYKPIIIMIHMYMIANWGGINIISAFTLDTFHYVIGDKSYDAILIITMDVQRIVSNIIAIYVMRRVKRRTMLFTMVGLNIAALVATGVYSYAKLHDLLAHDHVVFGALLIHIHTFSVVTGSLPLPMVISGEIFPMRYKSLAGGISALFYSLNFLLTVKTVLLMYRTVKIYGAYFIYAGVLTYCFIVTWFTVPETKDKILQDIEREFKGIETTEEIPEAQSLKSLKEPSIQ